MISLSEQCRAGLFGRFISFYQAYITFLLVDRLKHNTSYLLFLTHTYTPTHTHTHTHAHTHAHTHIRTHTHTHTCTHTHTHTHTHMRAHTLSISLSLSGSAPSLVAVVTPTALSPPPPPPFLPLLLSGRGSSWLVRRSCCNCTHLYSDDLLAPVGMPSLSPITHPEILVPLSFMPMSEEEQVCEWVVCVCVCVCVWWGWCVSN